MSKPKTRTRVRLRHFIIATKVEPSWTVECLVNRRWLPLHGEHGLDKWKDRSSAEARAKELEGLDFQP